MSFFHFCFQMIGGYSNAHSNENELYLWVHFVDIIFAFQ